MTPRRSLIIRIATAMMVLDHLNNGVWALTDGRGYYRALPRVAEENPSGAVSVILRDLGIARWTLAVHLATAAVLLDSRVLLVALGTASLLECFGSSPIWPATAMRSGSTGSAIPSALSFPSRFGHSCGLRLRTEMATRSRTEETGGTACDLWRCDQIGTGVVAVLARQLEP